MNLAEKRLAAALALAGALGSASSQDAPSLTWRAAAFSSLVVRGMQISKPGRAVALLGADLYDPSGWSWGGALTHLQSATGEPGTGISLRAGREWSLDDAWSVNLSARHDRYLDNPYLQLWCYNQLGMTLTQEDRWSVSAHWRPRHGPGCDNLPTAPNRALDLAARWPISGELGLDTSIGRLAGGPEAYTYGQFGLYVARGPATAYLARTQTWGTTPSSPGTPRTDGGHWVASMVWKF